MHIRSNTLRLGSSTPTAIENISGLNGYTNSDGTFKSFDSLKASEWATIIVEDDIIATHKHAYVVNGAVNVQLPLTSNIDVGFTFRIVGNSGDWTILQNDLQKINVCNLNKPGKIWTATATDMNWYSCCISGDGSTMYACVYGGGVYKSIDHGTTWDVVLATSRNYRAIACSYDGSVVAICVYNGYIYYSSNSGSTWNSYNTSTTWYSLDVSADGNIIAACVYGGRIYVSINKGLNWNYYDSVRNWYNIKLSQSGQYMIACNYGGRVYSSNNYGVTWTSKSPSNRNVSDVVGDETMTAIIYPVYGSSVYTSLNGGTTDFMVSAGAGNWINIAASLNLKNTYLIGESKQILITNDMGQNWSYAEQSRAWKWIDCSLDGKNAIACVNGGQIYVSLPYSTVGINGGIKGKATDCIEITYIGNNEFVVTNFSGLNVEYF